uniref:Zinc finger Ogr/Delta-type domain-containing protein n=1 Tax=Arsenophonus endosymbiont of Trialeurodes vaporariorum TaxID=235567 RepID=A0A3B0LUQ1_9GAMM
MMNCPLCGHAAHTRSSHQISENTRESYNQCHNINCGVTFVSHESLSLFISTPCKIDPVTPHSTEQQMSLAV